MVPARIVSWRSVVTMRPSQSPVLLTLGQTARKLFLSAFVIFTFLVYAVHERLAGPGLATASALPATPHASPTVAAPAAARLSPTAAPTDQNLSAGPQPTTSQPRAAAAHTDLAPSPTATAATVTGQYKDGQYIGPRVDAFYGFVK